MSSDNDYILDYARRIKARQQDEVLFMEKAMSVMPNIQGGLAVCQCDRSVVSNHMDMTHPHFFDNVKCSNDDFGSVDAIPYDSVSMTLSNGMCVNEVKPKETISDCDYVSKMVDHLNTAVHLAKVLLQSTKTPRMFVLAQSIITDESKDMFEISYLKNNLYNWKTMIPKMYL